MSAEQGFEVSTWADAEVQPGPGNPAHPQHEAWLAEQDQDDDERADEPNAASPESPEPA